MSTEIDRIYVHEKCIEIHNMLGYCPANEGTFFTKLKGILTDVAIHEVERVTALLPKPTGRREDGPLPPHQRRVGPLPRQGMPPLPYVRDINPHED